MEKKNSNKNIKNKKVPQETDKKISVNSNEIRLKNELKKVKEKLRLLEEKKEKEKEEGSVTIEFSICADALILAKTCPKFVEHLPQITKYYLLRATEELNRTFRFNVAGYLGEEITLHLPKNSFDPFFEKCPYDVKRTQTCFGARGSPIYDKIYVCLNKAQTIDLFSRVFEHCKAYVAKGWLQSKFQPIFFRHLTPEEIEKVILNEDLDYLKKIRNDFDDYLEKKGIKEGCTFHKIQIKFGKSDRQKMPFRIVLQVFKKVGDISGSDVLKLHFFFDTYTDGQLRGLRAIQHNSRKRKKYCEDLKSKREEERKKKGLEPKKKKIKKKKEEEKEENPETLRLLAKAKKLLQILDKEQQELKDLVKARVPKQK